MDKQNLAQVYQRNVDMVYRLSFTYLKNAADSEDAVQSIFIKLLDMDKDFRSLEHEKAWLIVTARNHCKDVLKNWWRKSTVALDGLPEAPYWDDHNETSDCLTALLGLREKYKTVLYLYYFEDYSVREISEILHIKESTIQTRLSKGRQLLKINLGGKYYENDPKPVYGNDTKRCAKSENV